MAQGPKNDSERQTTKRDQLIATALRLFGENGFRATGIDTILEEAGVAKMTLYKHFKSKDDLIVAVLRRQDEEWRAWLIRSVESRATTPKDRLLSVFLVLEDWFKSKSFHGCSFGKAATEFRDPSHAVHRIASEHKRHVISYLSDLAKSAGAKSPSDLAEQVCLLLEGAVMNMEVFCDPNIAKTASKAAHVLVESALPKPR